MKYGRESLCDWMWIAPPTVSQIEFKILTFRYTASISWIKNVSISIKIRMESILQSFWSVMVVALGLQKLQEDQNQCSWLALAAFLDFILRAQRGPEAFQQGFAKGLICASLEKLIFEGVTIAELMYNVARNSFKNVADTCVSTSCAWKVVLKSIME